MKKSNTHVLEYIRSKCVVDSNRCWNWTGTLNNRGRPVCSVNNKIGLVYRHTYEAFHNRPIKEGLFACHTCDNPKCCNPEHIFEGTNQDNQLDYKRKFVSRIGKVNSSRCPSNLNGMERVEWYKNNACDMVDECWIWNREIGEDGYGRVKYKGKKHMAHRLLWSLYNDIDLSNLDKNQVIRHICPTQTKPNKACCNPEHLKAGTRLENQLDTLVYAKSKKYNENCSEWLWIYYWYLEDGNKKEPLKVARGLRQLGLVSEQVTDSYVVDVLRGKSLKYLHNEFFDWTPTWK